MSRFLALLFTALLLLQILGPEVLVVSYQLNRPAITARYCVNKARPQLHCNGQCHLARQLRQAEGSDKNTPATTLVKARFDVLPTAAFVLPAWRRWHRPARRYGRVPVARQTAGCRQGVFRPPLILG